MRETNIFNNWLELDCFCYDIVEGWMQYRQSKNKEVSFDAFMEWVINELCPALECGFNDIYADEFESEENDDEQ